MTVPVDMLHVQSAIRENQLGRFEAAIAHAELAIRAGQGRAIPYLCAAYAAARLPGNDGALTWLDQALAIEPSNSLALNARAALLRTLGRDEAAVAAYTSAVDQAGASASVLTDFAILLLELGRRDAGALMIERALIVDRSHAAAWYTHAEMTTFGSDEPDIVEMERILQPVDPQVAPAAGHDRVLLHYALAKAHGDAGNGSRSREHLDAGSRLKRAELLYDPAIDERRMAATAAAFSAGSLRRLRGAGDPSNRPIFIVGMPRSGTTLVEQILASHPEVHAGGESVAIENLAMELGTGYPGAMPSLPPARISELAQRYLRMTTPATPAARTTDKMPYNFLHVGLIHALLPNARIVHCMRDPLDTCISCYSKLFTQGHEFSYDLAELGRYYRSYAALMDHWRSVIPSDCLLDVRYENVVDDLEGEARRLVEFCRLPWTEACTRFYDTRRTVRTASLHQVRQPIYRSSLRRWTTFGAGLARLQDAIAGVA